MSKLTEKQRKQFTKDTNDLIEGIIGATYTRHAKLNTEDFLKEIGYKDFNGSEKQAVNIAIFNALTDLSKEILKLNEKIINFTQYAELIFKQNGVIEEKK